MDSHPTPVDHGYAPADAVDAKSVHSTHISSKLRTSFSPIEVEGRVLSARTTGLRIGNRKKGTFSPFCKV